MHALQTYLTWITVSEKVFWIISNALFGEKVPEPNDNYHKNLYVYTVLNPVLKYYLASSSSRRFLSSSSFKQTKLYINI